MLHTGAHKINNALGQGLLVTRMGKKRIIAETGAGQHGVATATVAAKLGLTCTVYMGTEDMERQRLNVFRMRLLGAEVVGVDSGSRTLKDAINEAMRDWVTNVASSHYLLGSVLGAHPYPQIVRDFQKVIGEEAREQIMQAEGRLPDTLIACVGGGSNAIGLFHAFLPDASRENDRRGSGRARHRSRRTCGAAGGGRADSAARGPECCRELTRTFCRPATGRLPRRIRFRRDSIIPASVPSTPGSPNKAARNIAR